MNDEFYIGWEKKAAPGIGGAVRRVVVIVFILALVVPVVVAVSQRMIGASVFEWGTLKTVSGVFEAKPYPHLLVPRPGNTAGQAPFSAYYLVMTWKFGLHPESVTAFDGKSVAIKGTLIYRENQTMIETKPEWIVVSTNEDRHALSDVPYLSFSKRTLVGEIVDSKCYLGVMNPGQLATHRGCAIRCISGGCPPIFVVRQKAGPAAYFLLVSADGKPVNQQVLDMVAEPVEITGEIARQGDLFILRADPKTYRRVH